MLVELHSGSRTSLSVSNFCEQSVTICFSVKFQNLYQILLRASSSILEETTLLVANSNPNLCSGLLAIEALISPVEVEQTYFLLHAQFILLLKVLNLSLVHHISPDVVEFACQCRFPNLCT